MDQLKDEQLNLGNTFQSVIWGDLDPLQVPWVKLGVKILKANLMKPERTIELTAEVEPDFLHPEADKGKTFARKTLGLQDVTSNDLMGVIVQHLLEMAAHVAPSLYEIDPRIGMPIQLPMDMPNFVLSKTSFPKSPIFDPPRNNLAKEAELFAARRWTPICAVCGNNRKFEKLEDSDFYWGGGNVKWIHGMCAPWIEPVTVQPFRRDYGCD